MIDTDAALERLLADGRARAAQVDPHHVQLWDALEAATCGGKRFRPALVVAVHDALGGRQGAAVAQVGAAVELLHTAFVIHDDVIDGDDVRRGRPNVSGTFRADAERRGASSADVDAYALTAAVLAGDLALAAAVRAVATCGAPAHVVDLLLDLFDAALHSTAAGELADVRLSWGSAGSTLAESLDMEVQKTSVYSFSLPLQAGSVLAGADPSTTARLRAVGQRTGLAFQLVDDLVGVFADPDRSGKSATTDLRTAKQTPLLVHARSTPQWGAISGFVGRDLAPGELEDVRGLLVESGSRAFVAQLAEQQLAEARTVLDDLGLPRELVDAVGMDPAGLVDAREDAA